MSTLGRMTPQRAVFMSTCHVVQLHPWIWMLPHVPKRKLRHRTAIEAFDMSPGKAVQASGSDDLEQARKRARTFDWPAALPHERRRLK